MELESIGCAGVCTVIAPELQTGGPVPPHDPLTVARKAYQAYVDKDRAAIEALIGEPFSFTSPLDNRLDRASYFERCWPNSSILSGFNFVNLVRNGDRVFVTYECTAASGKSFRNTEILTIADGKIIDVEVYFGWSLPHEAPEGGSINP